MSFQIGGIGREEIASTAPVGANAFRAFWRSGAFEPV
jgi:hypothetical protein